ncbi:MAG: hypothetical protein IJO74_07210 [Clostridia bacterium]|nr:hypothetical protein [Clostridia bacterium]
MNSSSIKNFLIVLLVAVNLYLLFSLTGANPSNHELSSESLENYEDALKSKGIYVEAEQIPSEKYFNSIIAVNCSVQNRLSAAKQYLGNILAEYSLPNGITFQSEDAYISFFDDGKFEYGLSKHYDSSTFSWNSPAASSFSPITKENRKIIERTFSQLISYSNNYNKFSFRELGQTENDDCVTIYVELLTYGLPVHDGLITFIIQDSKPVYIFGKYLFDSFNEEFTGEYIDAPSALFLVENAISVEDIHMIYYPVMTDSDNYFLIPSWKIISSDGSSFIFDGVSGYKRTQY